MNCPKCSDELIEIEHDEGTHRCDTCRLVWLIMPCEALKG